MEGTEGYGYNQNYGNTSGGGGGIAGTEKYQPQPSNSNWAVSEPVSPLANSFRELCRRHAHEILAYCSVFWSFGMCVAFLGPTLLDLGCVTATDMKTISWVFFAQLLCSLIGSILAGYMAQRIDANLVLTIASTILPVVMFLIPFCRALPALALVLAIMGLNMGCIDCLANLQMIQMFGENVSPFLQALHFFYGLGAFVSPMIAEPFLLNEDCTPFIDNQTVPTPAPGLPYGNETYPAETLQQAQEMTRVKFAFWILCALQVPIPVIMGSLMMRMRWRGKSKGHQQLINSDSQTSFSKKSDYENIDKQREDARKDSPAPIDDVEGENAKPSNGVKDDDAESSGGADWVNATAGMHNRHGDAKPDLLAPGAYQILAVGITTASICFIYDGLQSAFGGYVYSYAVKSIVDLNKTEGAYLNACFWGMFALGRLLSIVGAIRFTPAFMLLIDIMGCLLAQTLMLALRHDHIALYFGTCFFGLFMSSITPTALSLAEQFIDVTSTVMSFVVVVAALGEMIFPVVVGNIFVTIGPVSFLWFGDISCLISVFVFAVLWYIGRKTPKQMAAGTGSFVWARMCCLRQTEPAKTGMKTEESCVNSGAQYYSQYPPGGGGSQPQSTGQYELSSVANNGQAPPY